MAACGAVAPQAMAQTVVEVTEVDVVEVVEIQQEAKQPKFAIKAYDNIGLGKAMSVTEGHEAQKTSSNYNAFGLDFGYTFFRKGPSSLEANIGVGYYSAGATFRLDDMSYHYNAPAIADEDGNEYIRYYELSNFKQKANLGYFSVPIYLEYQYKPLKWLGLHAEVGVGLGFKIHGNTGKTTGTATAWGVFPEYDDLLIDQDYLDDFGTRKLSQASSDNANLKGFAASIMCGAGFEFYAYEPVSFEVGVRYNYGLTNTYGGKYKIDGNSNFTADNAPVTYTVAGGTQVKSLGDYTTKSRLSPLSLHLGVNVRF